jgi:mRNA interferase HicA
MTKDELLRKLRKLAKARGVECRFDGSIGKGGHGRVWFGDRFTHMPTGELAKGTLHAILKQLGLTIGDLR